MPAGNTLGAAAPPVAEVEAVGAAGAPAPAPAAAAPLAELPVVWGSWTRAPLSTVMLDSLSASSSDDLRELDKQ